jgi:LysM repeat protein
VGMSGFPMGFNITPVVNLDLFAAQSYLLELTDKANFAPYNAGYRWQGDQLIGVSGSDGRVLDVGMTLENLRIDPAEVADKQRLDLVMSTIPPEVTDPSPYLEQAWNLAEQPFTLTGYDPFTDQHLEWQTDKETFTSWLEAGNDGLGLRAAAYSSFLDAQDASLNTGGGNLVRFLEPNETMGRLEDAIRAGQNSAELRIRYRGSTYEIEAGDTGYKIARKTGIPFNLITAANPGLEWEALSVGQEISLPTRDLTIPLPPVSSKRIIVNLDNQSLVAYENGQVKFSWLISSGLNSYPTYPGVFEILSHEETAFGSSFNLCGTNGCAQWQMSWFMGLYEVTPGLMNGFHGAVLLPNGAVLMGASNVGAPYTYGCVMSEDSNAALLFEWADEGTIVEIISNDFPPQSELGRASLSQASVIGSPTL